MVAWVRGCLSRLIAVSVLVVFGFPVVAQDVALPEGMVAVGVVEGIEEFRLPNGLQVLLIPDDSRPTITVNITYFVGSRHEGYGEAGMAHLLEHMLFKGTPSHPNISADLKEKGADFNATTWYDRTNYFETLPATAENLQYALRLEADRMKNSNISEADLRSEMTVVRNEFEQGENSPEMVLSQRMWATAYEWHGYGRSTIGNRSDIERVPARNLRAFYEKHYHPNNAMLIVAGKYDKSATLTLINDQFASLDASQDQISPTYTEEPTQDGERIVRLRRSGSVPIAGALYHVPAGAHEEFPAIEVLNRVLATDVSGRLYKALVATRKAASVSGAAYSLHDPGLLEVSAKAAEGVSADALLQLLLSTLDDVVRDGVTEEEVNRVRTALLKERELQAATSSQLAIDLSEWAARGDWRLYFLHRDRLEKVTAQDVSAAAAKYLRTDNRTVGLFEPTSAPARSPVPMVSKLDETLRDYKGREKVAAGEQFDPTPEVIGKRTEVLTFRSGIKAAILPKKTRGNTVVLRLTLRYGNLENLSGQALAGELLPELLTRGTKSMSRQQIEDELDRLSAQINATGRAGDMTFTILARQQTLPDVLALLRQMLREPSFSEEEFAVLVQEQLAQLEEARTDPQQLAFNAVRRALAPYGKNDPRAVARLEDEIVQLKKLTVGDVSRLHKDYVSGTQGELSLVGDFDKDTIVPSLESLFDNWVAPKKYARIDRSAPTGFKPGVERLVTPEKENATYFSALLLKMSDSHPDYPALEIGNFILGGGALSSRLADRVREKEGLSYGIQSMLQPSSVDERSVLMVFAISNPQNMPKAQSAISEEFIRLLKDGIPDAELEAAKAGWLQEQKVARASDAVLATLLANNLLAGRTISSQADLEEKIKKLTAEQVRDTLRKWIDVKQQFIAIAGDLDKKSSP